MEASAETRVPEDDEAEAIGATATEEENKFQTALASWRGMSIDSHDYTVTYGLFSDRPDESTPNPRCHCC
jgi:hypothetical protein